MVLLAAVQVFCSFALETYLLPAGHHTVRCATAYVIGFRKDSSRRGAELGITCVSCLLAGCRCASDCTSLPGRSDVQSCLEVNLQFLFAFRPILFM